MNRKNKQFRPILACGIAYVIWGINTPLIKTSLVSFPLFPLLALKYMIGAVVFMLLVRKKWQPLSSKLWLRIVVATFSGYFVNAILLYKGIELTGGLNTSLIYLLAPLALYFLSIRFLKERYNK
jgi:drug/metabolite transporter (DMT)-like permease